MPVWPPLFRSHLLQLYWVMMKLIFIVLPMLLGITSTTRNLCRWNRQCHTRRLCQELRTGQILHQCWPIVVSPRQETSCKRGTGWPKRKFSKVWIIFLQKNLQENIIMVIKNHSLLEGHNQLLWTTVVVMLPSFPSYFCQYGWLLWQLFLIVVDSCGHHGWLLQLLYLLLLFHCCFCFSTVVSLVVAKHAHHCGLCGWVLWQLLFPCLLCCWLHFPTVAAMMFALFGCCVESAVLLLRFGSNRSCLFVEFSWLNKSLSFHHCHMESLLITGSPTFKLWKHKTRFIVKIFQTWIDNLQSWPQELYGRLSSYCSGSCCHNWPEFTVIALVTLIVYWNFFLQCLEVIMHVALTIHKGHYGLQSLQLVMDTVSQLHLQFWSSWLSTNAAL